MRELIFIILLLLPLIGWGQAEKVHRSIIIDSLKALNGGSIDAKDTVKFEKPISIGGALDVSAILTITSNTQGLLAPRMNTAARDAITSPADGLLIYNNQTNQYEFFESTWQTVGGVNSIYDGSGSLSNNPTTVAQGVNKLQFTSSIVDAFSINGVTFSVDALNTRVGIGTATPSTKFNVVGLTKLQGINAAETSDALFVTDNTGITPLFIVENAGDVGIGTLNPGFRLEVHVGDDSDGIILKTSAGNLVGAWQASTVTGGGFKLENAASSANVVQFNTPLTSLDFINTGHNFGIGLDNPESILDVTAKTNSDGIFLRTSAGSLVGVWQASTVTGGGFKLENAASSANVVQFNTPLTSLDFINTGHNFGINTTTPEEQLEVNGSVYIVNLVLHTVDTVTLGVAATTFVVTSNQTTIVGDGGGNTISTITGIPGGRGASLRLIFTDGNVTITDTDDGGNDTIDLGASFTSADDTVLELEFNGTLWREVSRSVN